MRRRSIIRSPRELSVDKERVGTHLQPRNMPRTERPPTATRKTVFVVHGRNESARDSMFQFLRALGLEPLEWDQAVSLTKKGRRTWVRCSTPRS